MSNKTYNIYEIEFKVRKIDSDGELKTITSQSHSSGDFKWVMTEGIKRTKDFARKNKDAKS